MGKGKLAEEFLSTQVVERRLGPIGGRQLDGVVDVEGMYCWSSGREREAAGRATSRGPFSEACRLDRVAAEVVVVRRVLSGIVGLLGVDSGKSSQGKDYNIGSVPSHMMSCSVGRSNLANQPEPASSDNQKNNKLSSQLRHFGIILSSVRGVTV